MTIWQITNIFIIPLLIDNTVRFDSPLDQNPVLFAVSLELPTPSVTRKRLKCLENCLENSFPAINFSKFSGEGGRLDIGRHSADFNPVLSVPAKSISPRKPMLRNQNTWHVTCSPRPPVLSRPHADLRVWSFPRHSYILSFIKIRSEVLEPPGVEIGPFPLLLAISSLSAFFPWYYGSCIMPPQPPSSTQIHRYHPQAQIFTNPS